MVSRRHHAAAAPAPEKMFEGCRRARSLWGGVRLEVAGESSPVVLHSFTQLDPDLPPLEVSEEAGGFWFCFCFWGGCDEFWRGYRGRSPLGEELWCSPLCSLGLVCRMGESRVKYGDSWGQAVYYFFPFIK